jgi:aspartyl-tRNA(Asn)/glutamyl-tRNA(Gln) amidotransferase subunit C
MVSYSGLAFEMKVMSKNHIDRDILQRLCKLTKLEIQEEDVDGLLTLMNQNLETLVALDSIDTEGLEPLTNPHQMNLRLYPDEINDGNRTEELMKVAPKQLYNYFVVPKVIENK